MSDGEQLLVALNSGFADIHSSHANNHHLARQVLGSLERNDVSFSAFSENVQAISMNLDRLLHQTTQSATLLNNDIRSSPGYPSVNPPAPTVSKL